MRAGVSAVIENCMRNQARPLGGAATNISEYFIGLGHGRSDISEATMGCSQSRSGPLPAMKHLRVSVTEECDQTQKQPADGI